MNPRILLLSFVLLAAGCGQESGEPVADCAHRSGIHSPEVNGKVYLDADHDDHSIYAGGLGRGDEPLAGNDVRLLGKSRDSVFTSCDDGFFGFGDLANGIYILQPELYPELYGDMYHKVRINYYPPRGDNKEGWDNLDIFGWLGYPMQIKVDFLCRDSILAAPIVLDLVLFLDLAHRAGMSGIQEWLSFYFKSPQTAEGLYPEHDLFIQHKKMKNTLRWMMGEELITHLGLDYYEQDGS